MRRYNKILAAMDGSTASTNALRQALRLADVQKSWILATAVFPNYNGDLDLTGTANPQQLILGEMERILRQARAIAMEERGMALRTVVEFGEPHGAILDLARREGCDLIVLGRHGPGSIGSAVVGRVTARVIGYSQIDVLVVPEDAVIGWGRILLATDGSRDSAAATDKALAFAQAYGEEMDILSVVPSNDEFLALVPEKLNSLLRRARQLVDEVEARARDCGIVAKSFVREGEPAQFIVSQAREAKVDAVILGSHGRTGLRRLLMGSVAERVVALAVSPVLVVSPPSPAL